MLTDMIADKKDNILYDMKSVCIVAVVIHSSFKLYLRESRWEPYDSKVFIGILLAHPT